MSSSISLYSYNLRNFSRKSGHNLLQLLIPLENSVSIGFSYLIAIKRVNFQNEKHQNVDLNVWVIQKWRDDFLGWNPYLYGMINTTILPYEAIWLPDTYLYNRYTGLGLWVSSTLPCSQKYPFVFSVVMNREETERYINVVVTTNFWKGERGAEIKFMYPALYRTSCMLDIRFNWLVAFSGPCQISLLP